MNNDGKIIISKIDDRYILCMEKDNKPYYIYAYSELCCEYIPGTIINARVESNIEAIGASFVRYGKKKTGFINNKYKNETVIPVVYKKDPVGDKKALFTDKISISGQYVVVFDEGKAYVKTSSKIGSNISKALKKDLEEYACKYNVGILVRSKVLTLLNPLESILIELENIYKKIDYIRTQSANRPSEYILYQPLPQIITDCEELISIGTSEIVTDCNEVYDLLSVDYEGYFGRSKLTDRVSLRLYKDELLPLSNLYAFKSKLSECLSRIIYLKNGVTITFDNTEALTAIDVNSASLKYKSKDKESTFLEANVTAANEIFRHVTLRNISGIIIIDFINMDNKESYDILGDKIRVLSRNNNVKTTFHGFTALGLAEISRQKIRGSFREQMR